MERDDWIGLGTSLGVHLGLLIMFAFMTVASDPPPLGFAEVRFGPISAGQPTDRRMTERSEQPPAQPEPQPEEQPVEEEAEPQAEEKTPVELPEQTVEKPDDEVIQEPIEEETVQPETVEEPPEEVPEIPPEEPVEEEPQTPGQGTPNGTSGAPNTDEGNGQTDQRTSPFLIEGLNRDPMRAPLPRYTANVNAVIKVHIVVGPDGTIVSMRPDRKGNPALEQAVFRALRNWKFNELPAGVPQVNQEGAITFRFRLE